MLKLIASDMDGTMLDANECLPDGTYELILRLREEGIRFAATSGRRFDTLCELFEPIVTSWRRTARRSLWRASWWTSRYSRMRP